MAEIIAFPVVPRRPELLMSADEIKQALAPADSFNAALADGLRPDLEFLLRKIAALTSGDRATEIVGEILAKIA